MQRLSVGAPRDIYLGDSKLTVCLARVMRMVTASGIVAETGPETYAATPATKIYASPAFGAGIRFAYVPSKQAGDEQSLTTIQ